MRRATVRGRATRVSIVEAQPAPFARCRRAPRRQHAAACPPPSPPPPERAPRVPAARRRDTWVMASRVTSTTLRRPRRGARASCAPRWPRPSAAARRSRSSPVSRASARRGCCRARARRPRGRRARDRRRLRRAGGGRAALRADRRRAAPARPRRRPGVRRALATPRAARWPRSSPASATSERRDDEATAQARLFDGLLELLELLAGDDGLLLTIEDLHWADRSTRAFLVYLASSLCRERVLVVTTYRPDELHRRHPLRPLLAELERDARARRVELGR